ncbi:hypothetical protein CPB83DRAFT_292133 [Crepidotus variabilis]|uniref:Uncharacterized protein n=1 Tax=Crepidotus variabilis TaxID=179855 RepID=A0A9P6EHI4_9AGAR|nr:hypothetical protein CPB83DRAFT_292133 [Crepidotus variabilis]
MSLYNGPYSWVPGAFVDPTIKSQQSAGLDILIGSLAVLLWDFISTVAEDVRLVASSAYTIQILCYIIMRSTAIMAWFAAIISQTTLQRDCRKLVRVTIAFMVVNKACTSFVFFTRVCAVYSGNRVVAGTFGLLLLGVVAGSAQLLSGNVILGAPIGPTNHCTVLTPKGFLLFPVPMTEGIYDTLVCLAITYKLAEVDIFSKSIPRIPRREVRRVWWPGFLASPRLRSLSARFLRDSQFYFILTACVKIPQIIILLISVPSHHTSVSPIYFALIFPDLVIVNALASRIFRNLKLNKPGLGLLTADAELAINFTDLPVERSTAQSPSRSAG